MSPIGKAKEWVAFSRTIDMCEEEEGLGENKEVDGVPANITKENIEKES